MTPGAAATDQTSARQMNACVGRIGRAAVGHRRSGVIGENAVECGHDGLAGGFDPASSRRTRSIQSPAASCAFASVCPLRSVWRIYTIGKTHTSTCSIAATPPGASLACSVTFHPVIPAADGTLRVSSPSGNTRRCPVSFNVPPLAGTQSRQGHDQLVKQSTSVNGSLQAELAPRCNAHDPAP